MRELVCFFGRSYLVGRSVVEMIRNNWNTLKELVIAWSEQLKPFCKTV